jgi:hypothetical protein
MDSPLGRMTRYAEVIPGKTSRCGKRGLSEDRLRSHLRERRLWPAWAGMGLGFAQEELTMAEVGDTQYGIQFSARSSNQKHES